MSLTAFVEEGRQPLLRALRNMATVQVSSAQSVNGTHDQSVNGTHEAARTDVNEAVLAQNQEQLAAAAQIVTAEAPRGQFVLVQQWEGVVAEIGEESFSAVIKDLSDRRNDEEDTELFLDDVRADDRQLLKRGAVFYWSIGYEDTPRGRERKSIIVFRRLPAWTQRDVQQFKARAATLSSWLGSTPAAPRTSNG